MRRCDAAKLSLRSSQCTAHPRRKVVGAQSLGHSAGEAKRATQSQGCRCPKTCRHPASHVDRWHRVPLVIQGGRSSTRIIALSSSRQPAGHDVPAGTMAVVRSPLALRCFKRAIALHTLIHQRHPTPSCGGIPTTERTMDPARMFEGELDRKPGIREQPGSRAAVKRACPPRTVRPQLRMPPLQRSEMAKSATSLDFHGPELS